MLALLRNTFSPKKIRSLNFSSSKKESPNQSVYRRQLAKHLIPLNSAQGKRIFQQSLREKNCESFFTLIQHFNSQNQISTCASASLAMILNSLKIDPGINWKGIWRWYDDYNIKQMSESKLSEGLTLEQYNYLAMKNSAKSMAFSPLIVDVEKGSEVLRKSSLNLFRNSLISCHRRTNMLMTINFSRKSLSQTGSGHFSPLAAYNSKKDMALILDVAKFKYDTYWCSVEQLYESFKQMDPISKQSRGFLINKKNYQIDSEPESSLCTIQFDSEMNTAFNKHFQHFTDNSSLVDLFTHLINQNKIHILLIPILYQFYTIQMESQSEILRQIAFQTNFSYFSQISILNSLNYQSKVMIQAFTKGKKEDTLLFLGLVFFSNLNNNKFPNISSNGQQFWSKKMIKLIIKCQRSLQKNQERIFKY